MPEEQTTASAPAELAAFIPVDLRSFTPNRPPLVDVYYRSGNHYVLMCAGQLVMSRALKQRYIDSGVRVVYARLVGERFSAGGLELADLLALPDEHLPVPIKAGLLYYSAVSATRAAISDTGAQANDLVRACEFVGSMALQLSRTPETQRALLALMRHDSYVYVHSVNVAIYSAMLGSSLGVSREDVSGLSRAAFLHDVGKTRIPLDVLNKRGALTREDWKLIKMHPEWSVEILGQDTPAMQSARKIIMQHHERLDGRGYPHGLSDNEIDHLARIVALTDVFDAMTSERPYRPSVDPVEALRVVKRDELSGHLDRDVFVGFVRVLNVPNKRELESD